MIDFDLEGIPEKYGTKNCYDCGAEPPDGESFWHRFVTLHEKDYSVPCCDNCSRMFSGEFAKLPK